RERRDQLWQLHDVEDAPEIVGERGQAELAAHLLQPAHQKRTLVHPCLIEPNGCSTVSRRWSNMSGRWVMRACIRSNTASFSRRDTERKRLPVHCDRIAQSRQAWLLR